MADQNEINRKPSECDPFPGNRSAAPTRRCRQGATPRAGPGSTYRLSRGRTTAGSASTIGTKSDLGDLLFDAMGKRGGFIAVACVVGLIAWWFLRDTDKPLPSPEIALALAREEWQGYCDDPDAEWPCVIVTRIEMYDYGAHRVAGGEQGYCFDIYFHAETSRWNEAQGIPYEPRSYIEVWDPAKQCAAFGHNGVDDTGDLNAWSIHLAGDPWYEPWLQEMYESLR